MGGAFRVGVAELHIKAFYGEQWTLAADAVVPVE